MESLVGEVSLGGFALSLSKYPVDLYRPQWVSVRLKSIIYPQYSGNSLLVFLSHRQAQSWADLRQDVYSKQPADVHSE